jgi:hypothetical protein
MSDSKKSAMELIAGSTGVQMAAAALAAFDPSKPPTMSMVSALLPVLLTSLARIRADKRLQDWMDEVDSRLRLLGDHLNHFSDAQYRLTVGIVQTAFETIDEEKLRLLKAAILNIAGSDYLSGFHAQLFSRILRDVSAAEINFLAKHRDAMWFSFGAPAERDDGTVYLEAGTIEATLVRGAINLGLINRGPGEGTASDTGSYQPAPFVPELLDLIVGKKAEG